MRIKINKYLYDALLASKSILDFVKQKNFNDYIEDEMLQSAVERKFEIIGESLNRIKQLDEGFLKLNISDAYKIIGFRNILIHGYDMIDSDVEWNAIEKRLPVLILEIERILGENDK
jgi:uncharacterized protein with HEPN domain